VNRTGSVACVAVCCGRRRLVAVPEFTSHQCDQTVSMYSYVTPYSAIYTVPSVIATMTANLPWTRVLVPTAPTLCLDLFSHNFLNFKQTDTTPPSQVRIKFDKKIVLNKPIKMMYTIRYYKQH
jgi:hypothetical protein